MLYKSGFSLGLTTIMGSMLAASSPAALSESGEYVRCESRHGNYTRCETHTRGEATLERQLSNASCRRGRSWGYSNGAIWVDNGCRADFHLGGASWGGDGSWGGGSAGSGSGTIVCESKGYQRNYCRADTRGGVSLDQQLSSDGSRGGHCTYNSTWGYDSGGVWVSNGCRGRFQLGHPGSRHSGYSGSQTSSHHSDHDAEKIVGAALVVGAIAALAASQDDNSHEGGDKDWH